MGEKIEDVDAVIRHVKRAAIVDVPGEGTVVIHTAFERRPGEDSLSCAWREFYAGTEEAKLRAAVSIFRTTMTVRPSSGFVTGVVGNIRAAGLTHNCKVRVLRDPIEGHEAHSEVRSVDDSNLELLQLLADHAWSDLRISNTIPEPA